MSDPLVKENPDRRDINLEYVGKKQTIHQAVLNAC